MSESLAIMFQQEREHLSQLQHRLLTVNLQLKFYFFVIKYIYRVRLKVFQLMFTKN